MGSFYFLEPNKELLLSSLTETVDEKRFAFSCAELHRQI